MFLNESTQAARSSNSHTSSTLFLPSISKENKPKTPIWSWKSRIQKRIITQSNIYRVHPLWNTVFFTVFQQELNSSTCTITRIMKSWHNFKFNPTHSSTCPKLTITPKNEFPQSFHRLKLNQQIIKKLSTSLTLEKASNWIHTLKLKDLINKWMSSRLIQIWINLILIYLSTYLTSL